MTLRESQNNTDLKMAALDQFQSIYSDSYNFSHRSIKCPPRILSVSSLHFGSSFGIPGLGNDDKWRHHSSHGARDLI